MKPKRKAMICGTIIEEYYWIGKMVVYIDYKKFDGTYEEAVSNYRM